MDLLETLFEKVSHRLKRKREKESDRFSADLEAYYYTALAFCQGAGTDAEVLLKPVEHGLGVVLVDCTLLPERIRLFSDHALNRDILFHKALVAGAIRRLGLHTQYSDAPSYLERCIEIFLRQKEIVAEISHSFPSYAKWAEDLEARFRVALTESRHLSESDRLWMQVAQKLEKAPPGEYSTESLRVRLPAPPEHALALWCELMRGKQLLEEGGSAPGKTDRQKQPKPDAKVKKEKKASEIKIVDLEKEAKKENPVTHSFEKFETADDYQGGYRHADGADELEKHQDALDELDLKHVTRSGEAAQSIYQADISDLVETPVVAHAGSQSGHFISLPEWDYRKKNLRQDYCKLFLEPVIGGSVDTRETSQKWYDELIASHASNLGHWKQRLESLVNQRSWKDRQWDGSEVSIDAYVRYLSDSRHSAQGDPRLYMRSVRAVREFSAFVLVDQSLSTDSWVMNRRVLDVELESIAIMSYLLRELKEPIAVGGTYSHTRHRCSFHLYKNFRDDWNSFIGQVPRIQPSGYTRLGPAIRHATDLLVQEGGRQKLLILLTDGKPTDYDRYEGRYGIEDIRHANLEAKQKGVQVRALAIEKEAKNYFPHLFGKNEYEIIQDPAALPAALFRIYLDASRP